MTTSYLLSEMVIDIKTRRRDGVILLSGLRWIVRVGIGVALLWWILRWIEFDKTQLAAAIQNASVLDLGLAVACFVITMVLKTIQMRICLAVIDRYFHLFGVMLTQNALLTFLPWRMGEIGLPLQLYRHNGVPLGKTISAVVIIRLVDLLLIVAIITASSSKLGVRLSWAYLIGIIVSVGAVICTAKFWSPQILSKYILRPIKDAIMNLPNLVNVGYVIVCSVAAFVMATLQSSFALRAFGLSLSFVDVAILNAASLLIAVLPIHPPAGWGSIDLIQVVILRQLKFDPMIATPVILVTHAFYTAVVIMFGLLGWSLCRGAARR